MFEPLLAQARKTLAKRQDEIAPNLSVYVSSLAGAVAVKAELDETLACGLVSAAILSVSRVGVEPFEETLPPLE